MIDGEADILKSSRPTTPRISEPSVFEVAGNDSLAGERGTKVANVRQVVYGLPETTMDHEQEREWSSTRRKAQLSKVLRARPIIDALIVVWWRSLQDVAQAFFPNEFPTNDGIRFDLQSNRESCISYRVFFRYCS